MTEQLPAQGSQSWPPPAQPLPPHRQPWILAAAGALTAVLMTGAYLVVNGQTSSGLSAERELLMADAQSHVDHTELSKPRLIAELQLDGYELPDAEYAAEQVDADWRAEATGAASEALSYSAFSEQGLVEFLEQAGFSREEAEYGVGKQIVNWSEQAAILANSYLDVGIDTRAAMIDQLLYEGFTLDDAEYGANSVGLR